jgi:glycine/D-amino acid oxidase-like deaminating enzyme
VLIVGGGITGALMAYQLSKEGYKTILIDKRDVCFGSTSATTAMLQYEIDEPLYSLIEKVGENAAVDSYQEGVRAIEGLHDLVKKIKADCGFAKKKSLYIANTTKDKEWLVKEFETRLRHGLKVQWLTKSRLKSMYGAIGEAAILSSSGASVDAYALAHALLKISIKQYGLSVYDHTSLEKVEHGKNGNTVETDDGFFIKAKTTVYATGFETQSLIKDDFVKLISTYAMVSEPLSAIPVNIRNTIFWDTQRPYIYMRTTDDNRILIGGGDENFKNAWRRDRLIEKKEVALLKNIKTLFPKLSLVPDFSWAGTFGITKDSLPYIGRHPDFPNSFFVLGFGGNGITFSVMGMQIISDAIAGKHNRFLEYYKFNR